MKKLILTITAIGALFAGSIAANAQGRVQFSIPTTQRIIDSTTSAALFAPVGTYTYGLYIGAAGATAAQLTLVGTAINPASTSAAGATAGLFAGTNPYLLPATAGVDVTGGSAITFMIKGWETSLGSSYEAALAAVLANPALADANTRFGTSILGSITPTAAPTGAPAIFGTGVGQIQSFLMKPVPEPATLALAGLGAASLLLFRRRK